MNYPIVIVGLGQSAQDAASDLRNCYTIGVNDVAKFLTPDELLILDKPGRFDQKRLEYISYTAANHVWSPHQEWGGIINLPYRPIKTRKYSKDLVFDWNGEFLPHFLTSPFAAIGLAFQLGAWDIGLIGVDLLPDHPMSRHLSQISHQLGRARQDLVARRVSLYNCSPISAIKSLPFRDITEMNMI